MSQHAATNNRLRLSVEAAYSGKVTSCVFLLIIWRACVTTQPRGKRFRLHHKDFWRGGGGIREAAMRESKMHVL